MNALTAVGPDAVARREKQAAADDLDMSIGPDCRLKGRDPLIFGRGGIRGNTGNRSDPDAAFELQGVEPISLRRSDARDGECYERYRQSADDAPNHSAIPKLFTAIVIHFCAPLYLALEGLFID